jgi:hypothetical protein
VLRAGPDAAGALWVKVRLPVLPNGRVGWVRRQALGAYQTANTHFVVDRRRLRATLYRNGKAVFTAPVGVGTSEPQLLPGRVSHGCIRMRNPDILRLAELMPVGTPLTIR